MKAVSRVAGARLVRISLSLPSEEPFDPADLKHRKLAFVKPLGEDLVLLEGLF